MSQWVQQPATDGSRIWLPGIVACIAHHLPANEVASTLRLIDKATSQQLAHHRTLRLSLPSPDHVFRERWGRPGAFRPFHGKQRLQLLCLTAASGSVTNLEVALANAGLGVVRKMLEAAAAAGQLDVCKMLRERDCSWGDSLSAAAGGGHRHVCEWLLASGCPVDGDAVYAAARGGQEGLMHWLLTVIQDRLTGGKALGCCFLLTAAAEGLSLAALQRLRQDLMAGRHGGALQQQLKELVPREQGAILAVAAGSPTPDWQAKVEWLEGLGYPRTPEACTSAVSKCTVLANAGDGAVARLQWLRGQGYPLEAGAANAAVYRGNLAALRFLVEQAGVRPTTKFSVLSAACEGHLAVLRYLHASGWPLNIEWTTKWAAWKGCLPTLAWAVEALGATPGNAPGLLDMAVRSGKAEVMIWVHERGWAWTGGTITSAARDGCEEALEWLVERGCPFRHDGAAYVSAALSGDLAVLRCLHRLGCPWGPPGNLLKVCILRAAPFPALECLLDLGCPVEWDTAVKAAQSTPEVRRTALLDWLSKERRRRRSPGA